MFPHPVLVTLMAEAAARDIREQAQAAHLRQRAARRASRPARLSAVVRDLAAWRPRAAARESR